MGIIIRSLVFTPLPWQGYHRVTDQNRKIVPILIVRWNNGLFPSVLILTLSQVLARSGDEGPSSWLCLQGQTEAMP